MANLPNDEFEEWPVFWIYQELISFIIFTVINIICSS